MTIYKQTIVYTSGLFQGMKTEIYITVYRRSRPVPVLGSGYRVLSEEIVK